MFKGLEHTMNQGILFIWFKIRVINMGVFVVRKGIYTFTLSSDDGSRLTIADRLVVDHDGSHSMSERSGQVALHWGWHPIEVRYYQRGGGMGLRLEVEGPGMTRRQVPADWFAHLPEDGGPGGDLP